MPASVASAVGDAGVSGSAGSAASLGGALSFGFCSVCSVVSHGAGAAGGCLRTASHLSESLGGWICLTASCRAMALVAPCAMYAWISAC